MFGEGWACSSTVFDLPPIITSSVGNFTDDFQSLRTILVLFQHEFCFIDEFCEVVLTIPSGIH